MTPIQIITLIVGGSILAVLYVARLLARMEQYRRDLDGVEIDGDWLFDTVVPDHQREAADRTKQGRSEVRGVVGRVRIHREAE